MLTSNTRLLGIVVLILGVSALLVDHHWGRTWDIRRAREARGVLHQRTVEVLSVDAVAAVQTAYEALAQNRWAEAAAFTPAGEIAGSHVPLVWAVTYFARAIGAARMDQTVCARQDIGELWRLRDALVATRQDDWATHVEILSQVATAWVAQREGQHEATLQHLHAAMELVDRRVLRPVMSEMIAAADELFGEMLLEAGESTRALQVFETALERTPYQGNALYRAARAAELANDQLKARDFYSRLLGSSASTTDDRMKFAQARAFLANEHVILP